MYEAWTVRKTEEDYCIMGYRNRFAPIAVGMTNRLALALFG
jgi:hypothetical protein